MEWIKEGNKITITLPTKEESDSCVFCKSKIKKKGYDGSNRQYISFVNKSLLTLGIERDYCAKCYVNFIARLKIKYINYLGMESKYNKLIEKFDKMDYIKDDSQFDIVLFMGYQLKIPKLLSKEAKFKTKQYFMRSISYEKYKKDEIIDFYNIIYSIKNREVRLMIEEEWEEICVEYKSLKYKFSRRVGKFIDSNIDKDIAFMEYNAINSMTKIIERLSR